MKLHDVSHSLLGSAGGLVVQRDQFITDEHLAALAADRAASSAPAGNHHRVA